MTNAILEGPLEAKQPGKKLKAGVGRDSMIKMLEQTQLLSLRRPPKPTQLSCKYHDQLV